MINDSAEAEIVLQKTPQTIENTTTIVQNVSEEKTQETQKKKQKRKRKKLASGYKSWTIKQLKNELELTGGLKGISRMPKAGLCWILKSRKDKLARKKQNKEISESSGESKE